MPAARKAPAPPFPEPFMAAPGGVDTLCLWHAPAAGVPRALVVHVHAFAEEMNKSRRMCALQARALAAEGVAVLQFDLRGCGDSSADFAAASWDAWLAETEAACELALQRWQARWPGTAPAQCWLWGHRAGALLAVQAAARRPQAWQLLLWQPTPSGKTVLQQFLRLETAGALLGRAGAADKTSAKALLAAGQAADVAGYTLSPALAQGLEAARLVPPATAARVAWLDVSPQAGSGPSPVVQAQLQAWVDAGWTLSHHQVTGPAFWQTTEIEDAPALVEATTQALRAALAAPGAQPVPA